MGFGSLHQDTISSVHHQLNGVIIPKHLRFIENFLEKSSSGWLAGGPNPSIADFCFVPRLEWLTKPGVHDGIDANILTSFPLTQQLMHQFVNLPEVVDYYAQRSVAQHN
jgi:glutathione S-transferase